MKTKGKSINIIDKEYCQWLKDLSGRYRRAQIKAAVKVNTEMLRFYWSLGHDIVELKGEERWGTSFMKNLARDLKQELPDVGGLTQRNIYYCKQFYLLYSAQKENLPQPGAKETEEVLPQLGARLEDVLFSIPWGHHKCLIDKCSNNRAKALFYVRKTFEHGWSRNVLLNFLDTSLYERQGKADTNFRFTLPCPDSDLAQELTRDPYCFDFANIASPYNERKLKDALISNIEKFLIELGTGFAYMGREFRLEVGQTEQFLDMLFYNVRLRCYVVIEVKTVDFEPAHLGQLGGYVVAVDHILKTTADNKTIGLLICKQRDRILAQYALEATNLPLGISEYELERFYPEKVEGTMPTIEEIETKLTERMQAEGK